MKAIQTPQDSAQLAGGPPARFGGASGGRKCWVDGVNLQVGKEYSISHE